MKKLIITFVALTALAAFFVVCVSKQESAEHDHEVQCADLDLQPDIAIIQQQKAILGCK
jgi:hypothetical protein